MFKQNSDPNIIWQGSHIIHTKIVFKTYALVLHVNYQTKS